MQYIYRQHKLIAATLLSIMISVSTYPVYKAEAAASGSTVIVGADVSIPAIVTQGQTVINTGASLVSKYTNLFQFSKENFLDFIAYQISRAVIKQMRDGMIRWIKSGYQGKPSFLVNPEQMIRNMAAAQAKMVLNDVGNYAKNSSKSLSKALIYDIRDTQLNQEAAFQKSITPTLGVTIQNNVCSAEGFGILMRSKGWTDAEAKNARKMLCEDGLTGEQQKKLLGTCFKENFKCGGWNAWLDMTQNQGRNTEVGQLNLAINRVKAKTATNQKQATEELNRGSGFFNIKECIREKHVTINDKEETYCDEYQSTSPGQKAVSLMGEVVTDPIKQARLVDEINESVSTVASAFLSDLAGRGFAVVNEAVNNLNVDIAKAKQDFNKSVNGEYASMDKAIKDFTKPNASTPAPAYDQTNLQVVKVEASSVASLARNVTRDMVSVYNANVEYLSVTKTNIAIIKPYNDDLNRLSACYDSIATGTNQTMVSDGRDYIANRTTKVTSVLPDMLSDIQALPARLASLKIGILFIASSTDVNAIQGVYQAFNKEVEEGVYKKVEDVSTTKMKTDEYSRDIDGIKDANDKVILKGDRALKLLPMISACECVQKPNMSWSGGQCVDNSTRYYETPGS